MANSWAVRIPLSPDEIEALQRLASQQDRKPGYLIAQWVRDHLQKESK